MVPVAVPLLKKPMKHQSDNVFTKFTPDVFNSKVVLWKGWRAYIGPANHMEREWLANIEASVFFALRIQSVVATPRLC